MSDRKVILKMVMSLDGFATSTDVTHEWMFEWFGDDSGEWNRRALEEAGIHAMGRRSYEIMGPHWAASDGPIATAMNEKPKAVFSHTLERICSAVGGAARRPLDLPAFPGISRRRQDTRHDITAESAVASGAGSLAPLRRVRSGCGESHVIYGYGLYAALGMGSVLLPVPDRR